jgi:hypothetical protein
MSGKRSPINEPNHKEEGDDDGMTAIKKRLKITDDNSSSSSSSSSSSEFRGWSKDISDNSNSSSTVYTFKCVFGDPSKPLPSWIKTSKVSRIKELLQYRKQSTEGSKKVLLDRLQTDLPFVILEIDSRECLQRLVSSFLYHMKWDPTHLFVCKMPARGPLKAGTGNLWMEAFGIDIGMIVQMGQVSSNPFTYPERQRKRHQDRLDAAGLDWSDFDRAKREPNARGKWRKLQGSGFDPHTKPPRGWDDDDDEEPVNGGAISLHEIALEKGDKIQMTYDFGDNHKFSIIALDKQERQTSLAEVKIFGLKTRVALVKKSETKMPKQHEGH